MLRREFINLILCANLAFSKLFANIDSPQNQTAYSSITPETFSDGLKKMSVDDKLRLASEVSNITNISALTPEKYFLAMAAIQTMADEISRADFLPFARFLSDAKTIEKLFNKYPILRHYEASFDKVLRELSTATVSDGEIYLWHIYNMGYVFKTNQCCFAVDINHRRAAELEKYIDFLLITHNHQDHFTPALIDAMKKSSKPIISNFIECNGFAKDGIIFDFRDVKIITSKPIAHNKRLPKFVTTFEIIVYKNSEPKLGFLHSGDAHNYKELEVKIECPHILIPHIRVGLNIPQACKKIGAQGVFASHILELAHDINKWRWSVFDGFSTCAKPEIKNCRLPMWGEKITCTY